MIARKVRLGELGTWGSGGTPLASRTEYYGGDIPWLIIEDLNDGFVDKAARKITRLGLENSSAKIVPPGTLLIAMYGSIGKLGINRIVCATNQAIAYCKCNPSKVDTHFLFHFLRNERSRFLQAGRGGTQQNINQEFLKEYEVLLPPLSEQQRIAKQLEQADRLRRTRRYALELSDSFLSAAFLELFGDFVHNERHWRVRILDEIADIASGIAKGQKYGNRETREVPYLRVANVQDGYLDLSEIKMIDALPGDVEHLRLQKGDIVMTEGGDFDKLGRGAIWPGGIKDCIHQNHIFRVRVNKSELMPEFFAAFLRSPAAKNYFLRCSKQTTNLASINMSQLRATPVALPPLPLQKQFVALVARHERLRATQHEALRQAEHLFQTLLHKAFTADQ
jgi:type I restriction enzyme S subunit